MTVKHQTPVNRHTQQPDRGQVAAARLLVKRAEEGKATIPVTQRVRRMAEGR